MLWSMLILQFVLGLVALVFSANRFIGATTVFARHFKMSNLAIGMLLVGFGTSLPELFVSAQAALHAAPQLAIGNIIGSNIANKALVGGFVALVIPIEIHSRILKREFPVLFVLSLIVAGLLYNGFLGRIDGIILLVLFVLYLLGLLYWSRRDKGRDSLLLELEQEIPKEKMALWQAGIWWVVSLGLLLLSSHWIVVAATKMAHLLGVSNLLIGLTVVAVGTSLPEMAATVTCAYRREFDMAVGNIVGSSIFNILPVLAMPALLSPGPVQRIALLRDYPIMLGFIALFWFLAVIRKGRLGRLSGVILLLAYGGYLALLVSMRQLAR